MPAKCTTRHGAAKPSEAPAKSAGCYRLNEVITYRGRQWQSKNVRRGGKTYRRWVRYGGDAKPRARKGRRAPAVGTPVVRPSEVAVGTKMPGRDGRPYIMQLDSAGRRRWFLDRAALGMPASSRSRPPKAAVQAYRADIYDDFRNSKRTGHCKNPTAGRARLRQPMLAPGCAKAGVVITGNDGQCYRSVRRGGAYRWEPTTGPCAMPGYDYAGGTSNYAPLLSGASAGAAPGAAARGRPGFDSPPPFSADSVNTGFSYGKYTAINGRWVRQVRDQDVGMTSLPEGYVDEDADL